MSTSNIGFIFMLMKKVNVSGAHEGLFGSHMRQIWAKLQPIWAQEIDNLSKETINRQDSL